MLHAEKGVIALFGCDAATHTCCHAWCMPAIQGVLSLPLLSCASVTDHNITVGSSCMVEPEVIGTLTRNLGSRHGTHRRLEIQSGEGPLGQRTEARAQLGLYSSGRGQTVEVWRQMDVKKAALEATRRRKEQGFLVSTEGPGRS